MTHSPDQPRTGAVACLYAILAKLNEPNLGDRHFFEWLDNASIDYLKGANAELTALRTRLEEAERDSKRLEQLQAMILPDDPLHEGDVTLNAFTYACNEGMPDEFRAPCVQIYLGEHPIPTGIGDTLRAAIDHAATPSKEQDHE